MKIQEEELLKLLVNLNPANKNEIRFLLEHPEFDEMPCQSFKEFIENPLYLGIGEDVWQKVKDEGEEIWRLYQAGKISEAVLLWGIGSGKSFLSSTMALLFVHWLLCLGNPHKSFKIANDKPIAIVNMGTTATQAKNVIFTSLRKLIEISEFFQRFEPEILQTEIRFHKKNIVLYCGNSQETMPIGLNVLFGALDEAAWYLDTEQKSTAENIYEVMKNRIVSRFGDKGFLMIISAPRYVDDFISRHYEKAKEMDFIYTSMFKTWEVKDRNKMKLEMFRFKVSENEVWEVPMDFYNVAMSNPEKFMRDFGARPSLVIEAFDRDSDIVVRQSNKERESPIDEFGGLKDDFRCEDNELRYIHIDLGLTKDACGFVMGKNNGYDIVDNERRVKVFIDLMMQLKVPSGGEIKFSEVRQLVYSLQERGFKIKKVTFDGWQSADSIQILKGRKLESEVLSVDRNLEPYETLKELLHTKRLDYYRFPVFEKEYKMLELVKGKKVDHPVEGSKDVADGMAGVCYNIVKDAEKVVGHFEKKERDIWKPETAGLLDKEF